MDTGLSFDALSKVFLQVGGGLAPCGWSRQGQEEGSCVYELVQDEWSKCGKNRNYTPLSGDILCIFARVFYAPPCQPMNER